MSVTVTKTEQTVTVTQNNQTVTLTPVTQTVEVAAAGPQGAAGAGVPVGGTAGQVLSKIDGTDYNTQWVTGGGISTAGWEAFTFGTAGIVATHPRFVLTTTRVPTSSGQIQHSKIVPHRDFTVTNIAIVGTTAASVPTLIRFGIYTRSGTTFTLVARTASDTTIFNATNTKFTRALDTTGGYPATYTMIAGTEYFISVIQVATGQATLLAATARESTAANAATGGQHYTQNSQADLPASSTGTLSATIGGTYAEVS
jgi:hypothetical protein